MIALVSDLVAREVAYETPTACTSPCSTCRATGCSPASPSTSLRAGARVEADEDKRSPLDFVLWKKAKPGEPTWDAPLGAGRPGWHTECVVMSLGLLGEGFDLHGGGQDLMFPHHENERAQAVADGKEFARHWMHNGWVTVGGEKMSKSLGNFTSLSDLLERSDARAYRLLVLRSHYRSPIEVTPDTIAQAEAGLARLDELARRFGLDESRSPTGRWSSGRPGAIRACRSGGWIRRRWPPSARAWTTIWTPPGPWPPSSTWPGRRTRRPTRATTRWPGVPPGPWRHWPGRSASPSRGEGGEVDPATAALVLRRDSARARRDWAEADAVRAELESTGWLVEDAAGGTRVRRR